MSDVIKTLGSLLLFMFIPLFIPIITSTLGLLHDTLTRGQAKKGWQRDRAVVELKENHARSPHTELSLREPA